MVLNAAVFVFVFPANQANVFPTLEPFRHIGVLRVVDGFDEVQSRKGSHRGCGSVQQSNENQRIACGLSRIGNLGHSKEAHDNVG